jgi:protein subunit release factor B
MLRFPVSTQKQADLNERMQRLALVEGEIEESFFKASSPGGQKANKTLSGVSILHVPTQIRIRCQRERSQGINRFIARRLLVEELEARRRGMTRHSAKAERLHEEKERKNGSHKKQPANGAGALNRHFAAAEKPAVFDLARAMAAYYLRPLA